MFNVAIAEELKVCMQHTKHNHLEVNKLEILGTINSVLKVKSVGKTISHVHSMA